MQSRVPVQETKSSKPLAVKTSRGFCSGINSKPQGKFVGENHGVLECTQTHPPQNQHQEGPICLQAVGEVTESRARAEQTALFPL